MKIIKSIDYLNKLKLIMEFIAEDNIHQALAFEYKLNQDIENLIYMPYKFRKSFYF